MEKLILQPSPVSLFMFVVFFLLQLYWIITAHIAQKQKPKKKKETIQSMVERMAIGIVFGIVGIQLLGFSILSFSPTNITLTIFGFLLYMYGIIISMYGRKEIHTNWAGSYNFQIKENHTLVKTGIYHLIRHPIYSGLGTAILGVEIFTHSYLLIGIPILFFILYLWARREERLLEKTFRSAYLNYKKQTKMFIPFLF